MIWRHQTGGTDLRNWDSDPMSQPKVQQSDGVRHHLGQLVGTPARSPTYPARCEPSARWILHELRRSGYITGYGVGYVAGYPRHVTALQSWKLTKEESRPRVHTTSKLRFCPVVQAELCSAGFAFSGAGDFYVFYGLRPGRYQIHVRGT